MARLASRGEEHISVALCTYNGARFLPAQLQSMLEQTRRPDELVVCDDGSSDATRKLLQDFQHKAPFPVRLHFNRSTLGSTQNFAKAIRLCKGDLIVLADQDDVWLANKLTVLEKKFLGQPDIGIVFSDAEVVDAQLGSLGYTLWQYSRFSAAKQTKVTYGKGLEVLLKHVVVTGATLAFRRRFLRLLLPIPEGWIHDAWIALMISACSNMAIVTTPLVLYRQHGANQIGAIHMSLLQRMAEALRLDRNAYYDTEISRYEVARRRLFDFPDIVNRNALVLIDAKLAHLHARRSLPSSRFARVPFVFRELVALRYYRYSFGWQVAIKDLLLPA